MSDEEDLDQSGFHQVEMDRRLGNILKQGTVVQLDEINARVQVEVDDELTTDWLPWFSGKAGKTSEWSPPEIGEQVMILSPSGELAQGWVMRGTYKDDAPHPFGATKTQHITLFEDGSKTIYDLATKTMTVICVGDVVVQAAGNINLTAVGQINLTAGTQLNLAAANINIVAAVAIGLAAPAIGIAAGGGGATFSGDTDWSGNVTHHNGHITSNGIVVDTHHHSGVMSGPSVTGPPV